ncbi:MAG: hypothetical protein KF764_22725 [Labilithrix sp.]|nr:hypothetical protein [Labilithrix sp.]
MRLSASTACIALFVAILAGCTTETVVSPQPSGTEGPDPAPGDEPSDPSTPKDPDTTNEAKAPSVKLDATFKAISDAKNDIYAAVPAAGGKTYVALRKAGGAIGWGSGTLVRRYLASGTLDSSFGTQGEVSTVLVANPSGLGVDADGRVLVGGTGLYDPDVTSDTGREIVVLRLTGEGDVDTGYGRSGRAMLTYSAANTHTSALHVLSDGSVFVSAWGRTSGKETFGAFLVNPAGVGVSTFGTNGFLSSPFPVDGALAVGGEVLVPTTSGLMKYDAAGASKGAAIQAGIAQVKVGKDGSYTAIAAGGEQLYLARFSKAGVADASFDGPEIGEDFADFVVLADNSVLYADAAGISWVGPKGGSPTVIAKDVAAQRLALTADGKLLVTSVGKVARYTF